jgi:hypothetical protein
MVCVLGWESVTAKAFLQSGFAERGSDSFPAGIGHLWTARPAGLRWLFGRPGIELHCL